MACLRFQDFVVFLWYNLHPVKFILYVQFFNLVNIKSSSVTPKSSMSPWSRCLPSLYPSAAAKSLQSCPTLCDPIDGSPPGSSVHRILQAKNTGVGCHFLLQCMKVKSESEVAQSCLTLEWPHGLQPTRLLRPWDFPGKSTGVGCHCLLCSIPLVVPFPECQINGIISCATFWIWLLFVSMMCFEFYSCYCLYL